MSKTVLYDLLFSEKYTQKNVKTVLYDLLFSEKKKKEKNSTTMIFSNRKTYLSNMCPTPCYMCELSIDRI